MIYYIGLIFKNILPEEYFNHFLLLVTFIRILTKDELNIDDFKNSYK